MKINQTKQWKIPKPQEIVFLCKNKGESGKIHIAAETMFLSYSELQWKTKTTNLGAKREVGPVVQNGGVHACNELLTLEHYLFLKHLFIES